MTNEEAIRILTRLKDQINFEWTDAQKKMDALNVAIEALQDQRWIPRSERLPLDQDSVLITDYDYWIDIGYYDGQTWHYSDAVGTPKVVAWMPLPDPYGEES